MITSIKKLKNSEAEMIVQLDQEDLKKYIKRAEGELAQVSSLDGFRPGRVPSAMLRKRLGDHKILEVAMDLAVKESFIQALRQEKLEVVSSLDLKVLSNSAEGLKYLAKLLLWPEVRLGTYRGLALSARPIKVEEKEIAEAINFILKSRTVFQAVDRPAQEGDHLEIDFEVRTAGGVIEGGKSENHPFILGQGNFIPGFEEQLKGLKKGEHKEFFLQAPEDYYQKSIAGKKLEFLVTIKAVKFGTRPELTDELARSLGRFASVQDLKDNIVRGLEEEKKQKEKERMRLEILEKIEGASVMDIPISMVEEQLAIMVSNFDQHLHGRGLELDLYLAHLKKNQKDLEQEWRPQAEKQVRRGLVLRAIGKKENIAVEEEEAEATAKHLIEQYLNQGQNSEEIDFEGLKNRTRESLLNEKIFQFLETANLKNQNSS